jgi:hypothetical protein
MFFKERQRRFIIGDTGMCYFLSPFFIPAAWIGRLFSPIRFQIPEELFLYQASGHSDNAHDDTNISASLFSSLPACISQEYYCDEHSALIGPYVRTSLRTEHPKDVLFTISHLTSDMISKHIPVPTAYCFKVSHTSPFHPSAASLLIAECLTMPRLACDPKNAWHA